MQKQRISIRLDPDTLSEVTAQAAAQGMTVSAFIREIIYAYLEVHS